MITFFRRKNIVEYKSTIYPIALNAISKLVVFTNSFLIGSLIGTNNVTDIYFIINSINTTWNNYINQVNSDIFIPKYLNKESTNFGLIKKLSTLYVIIAISVFIFIFIYFNNQVANNIIVLLLFLLIFILSSGNSLQLSLLNAKIGFTTSSVLGLIINLLALVFLITFHRLLGIYSILIGLTVGYISSCFFSANTLDKNSIASNVFNGRFEIGISKEIRNSIFFVSLQHFGLFFFTILTTKFTSTLGDGFVTVANYSSLISIIPFQIVAFQYVQIITVKLFRDRDLKSYVKSATQNLVTVVIIVCAIYVFFNFIVDGFIYSKNKNYFDFFIYGLNLYLLSVPINAITLYISKIFIFSNKLKLITIISFSNYVSNALFMTMLGYLYGFKSFFLGFFVSNFLFLFVYAYFITKLPKDLLKRPN